MDDRLASATQNIPLFAILQSPGCLQLQGINEEEGLLIGLVPVSGFFSSSDFS